MLPTNSAMMCCLERRRTRVEKNRLWLLNDSSEDLGQVRVYLSTGTVDKHLSHACQHGKSRGRPFSLHISCPRLARSEGRDWTSTKQSYSCRKYLPTWPRPKKTAPLVMPASQQNPSQNLSQSCARMGSATEEPRIDLPKTERRQCFQTSILRS